MNSSLLKGEIRSRDLTQEDVAASIGLSLSRFNAKINSKNEAEFSLGEVKAIRNLFGLTPEQVDQIFFK